MSRTPEQTTTLDLDLDVQDASGSDWDALVGGSKRLMDPHPVRYP